MTTDTATDDFAAHVALIRAERPHLTAGEARFAAWQEGPEGLEARRLMPETDDRAPTVEDLAEAAEELAARFQIFDSLERAASPAASSARTLYDLCDRLNAEAEDEGSRLTYAIAKVYRDGSTTYEF